MYYMYYYWDHIGQSYYSEFFYLGIIWVVNIVESFIGFIGTEVLFDKLYRGVWLFFTCNCFHHFYFYYIEVDDWQYIILFYTMRHKKCDHQLYFIGLPEIIYWLHKNHLRFVIYYKTTNTSWYGRNQTREHI